MVGFSLIGDHHSYCELHRYKIHASSRCCLPGLDVALGRGSCSATRGDGIPLKDLGEGTLQRLSTAGIVR